MENNNLKIRVVLSELDKKILDMCGIGEVETLKVVERWNDGVDFSQGRPCNSLTENVNDLFGYGKGELALCVVVDEQGNKVFKSEYGLGQGRVYYKYYDTATASTWNGILKSLYFWGLSDVCNFNPLSIVNSPLTIPELEVYSDLEDYILNNENAKSRFMRNAVINKRKNLIISLIIDEQNPGFIKKPDYSKEVYKYLAMLAMKED